MPMTVKVKVREGQALQYGNTTYRDGFHEVDLVTAAAIIRSDVTDLPHIHGDLLRSIDELVKYDPKILERPELGAELNFHDLMPVVENVQAMFNNMASLDGISFLADDLAESLNSSATNFMNAVRELRGFRTSHGQGVWEQLSHEVKLSAAELQRQIAPNAGLLQLTDAPQNSDVFKQAVESVKESVEARMLEEFRGVAKIVQEQISKDKETLESAKEEIADSKKQAQESLAEIENIKAAARDASGKLGIGEDAKYFEEEARRHRMAMWGWFGGTIVTAIILIIYIWGAYIDPSVLPINLPMVSGESKWGNAILFAGRTLIFGVFAYIVFLCGKNFLAHKHNFVINQHRWQALQTYRAIVEANDTPQAREVVLHYAAKCIFSPQETGFSKNGGGAREMSLIESIRKITPSGGGD